MRQVSTRQRRLDKSEAKLASRRKAFDAVADTPLHAIGAFVTFEWERSRNVSSAELRPS